MMTINALRYHGFATKFQVRAAYKAGLLTLKPQSEGGGGAVYSIGKIGIRYIEEWLGYKNKEEREADKVDSAIKLIRRHGYRVDRN